MGKMGGCFESPCCGVPAGQVRLAGTVAIVALGTMGDPFLLPGSAVNACWTHALALIRERREILAGILGSGLGEQPPSADLDRAAIDQLYRLDLPVVAAVNGAAIDMDLLVIARSDAVVASSHASFRVACDDFRYDETLGRCFASRVGSARSRYLLMTGRVLPAVQAAEWGLVNVVVPPDTLQRAAMDTLIDCLARRRSMRLALSLPD